MGIIRKQGFTNILISYFGILLGFLSLIVIQPLLLDPEEVGLLRLLLSFSILVSTFVPLGITNIAIRFYPRIRLDKDHGFFWILTGVVMIGFLIASAALILGKDFITDQYQEGSELFSKNYELVFPLIFFLSFVNGYTSLSFSHLKTVFPSVLNDIVTRVGTILIVILYAYNYLSFNAFLQFFIGIYGFQFLLLTSYLILINKPSFRIDFSVYKRIGLKILVSYGGLLLFSSVASIGLKSIDSIIIGRFVSLEAVAVYAIAAFVASIVETPLNSILKIISPRLSEEISEGRWEKVGEIYRNSCFLLTTIGGYVFLMVILNITSLLYFLPDVYHGARDLTYILSFGALINMATGVNNVIIINSGDYRRGAFYLIGLFSITIVLDLLLVPFFGTTGAALATLISVLIFNLANYFYLLNRRGFNPILGKPTRILLLIVLGTIIHFILPHYPNPIIDIIIRTLLGTIYFAGTILLFVDSTLSIKNIKSFLNK